MFTYASRCADGRGGKSFGAGNANVIVVMYHRHYRGHVHTNNNDDDDDNCNYVGDNNNSVARCDRLTISKPACVALKF